MAEHQNQKPRPDTPEDMREILKIRREKLANMQENGQDP